MLKAQEQKAEMAICSLAPSTAGFYMETHKWPCSCNGMSNASRTMLFNIHALEWDEGAACFNGYSKGYVTSCKSSSEVYGYTQNILTAESVPVAGIAGDQQSALFGQMCIQPGMVKTPYGTGCFMLMNTGGQPVYSTNTTYYYRVAD